MSGAVKTAAARRDGPRRPGAPAQRTVWPELSTPKMVEFRRLRSGQPLQCGLITWAQGKWEARTR